MNDNVNRQKAIDAIWANPGPLFGCDFKLTNSGKYWANTRGGQYAGGGMIRLMLTASKTHIKVFGNSGSGIAGISDGGREGIDVFTYLENYVIHCFGFHETLKHVADVYGFSLDISPEEKKKLKRAELSRELCASVIEALRKNPDGPAGRYLRDKRGLQADGLHFGELTAESIQAAKDHLRARNIVYDNGDIQALGFTEDRARNGYNLVIPYYHNGSCTGFVFRNILDVLPNGAPKYLYSEGLTRGVGYCDRITPNVPAVVVEGQLDAIRAIQAGTRNVIAFGGASLTEDLAAFIHNNGIKQITYIPDHEYNPAREKETETITRAVRGMLKAAADGERVITNLYIAELPTPPDMFTDKYAVYKDGVLKKYKTDADTYGKDNGPQALAALLANAREWWAWELDNLLDWAKDKDTKDGTVNVNEFQNKFDDIYNQCLKVNPYDKARIRDHIKSNEIYGLFGVTPGALDDVDGWNRERTQTDRIKAAADDLVKVVDKGANPVKVAEVLAKLADIQASDTREEWAAQMDQTFAEELKEIQEQPDALKTKWDLGNIDKLGNFIKYNTVEFYPADITVFCAATSHGKTAILFQSVLDMIAEDRHNGKQKIYLYVSCEENKRQLLERALNVYMDIPTTATGKDGNNYCFIEQTRKKSIKAAIRGGYVPEEYKDITAGYSEHFGALKKRITEHVERYGREVRPFLKLIHTDGTAESITANAIHYVEKFRDEGQEVGGVFIDYAQLLTSEVKTFSRQDELKGVFKSLEKCAKKTELPFIIAAQLNRKSIENGIDDITLANLGEAADIERAAHDVYLVWQVDKTKKDMYLKTLTKKRADKTEYEQVTFNDNAKDRARRIFIKPIKNELRPEETPAPELKAKYLYVETMKARDGKTGGWGLLPFDGERGSIAENDKYIMSK